MKFGPLAATKMACPQGMELETAYLAALGAMQRYRFTGTELEAGQAP